MWARAEVDQFIPEKYLAASLRKPFHSQAFQECARNRPADPSQQPCLSQDPATQ